MTRATLAHEHIALSVPPCVEWLDLHTITEIGFWRLFVPILKTDASYTMGPQCRWTAQKIMTSLRSKSGLEVFDITWAPFLFLTMLGSEQVDGDLQERWKRVDFLLNFLIEERHRGKGPIWSSVP